MDESSHRDRAPARDEWLHPTLTSAWESVRGAFLAHKAEVLVACLLLALAANLLSAISRKSISNDETVHIPAGYYHLVDGYFQLNNEHPPLIKMWAALPLLLIQPEEGVAPAGEADGVSLEVTWSHHQRFWASNSRNVDAISFWTRAMMVPIALALGVLIFVFAQDLFGARAAVFAVALYTLEPTVLAHGRIVHTDVPGALAFLLFFFVLWRYVKVRTTQRALLLGVVSGVALVTKFSMMVILPVLLCLSLAALAFSGRFGESRRIVALHAGLVLCVLLVVVNATYYFSSPAIEPADEKWVQMKSPESHEEWLRFFNLGAKIVPAYFLFGQYNVMLHNRDGHPASLLGQYGSHGWWHYFPVAFALKTTVPFLILAVAAIGFGFWQITRRRNWRFLWLLIPFVLYTGIAMSSNLNIGIRHLLPAYPFLFIGAGALLDRLLRVQYLKRITMAVVVAVFGWMIVEMLRTYPDYIPYGNQLAANGPLWWYLSDSNVEWGDDARELAVYLHARGETEVRGAVAGGWTTLGLYGVTYYDMMPRPGVKIPETRYVAIGASFLNGSTVVAAADEQGNALSDAQRVNYFATYRWRTPETVIGRSIYVYRVR